ncbi:MAG: hypothetical protein IPJ35_07315 [Elusimicrobia bacterium]|nr:hypothetical protein [Elusimicrobiota bacterium]
MAQALPHQVSEVLQEMGDPSGRGRLSTASRMSRFSNPDITQSALNAHVLGTSERYVAGAINSNEYQDSVNARVISPTLATTAQLALFARETFSTVGAQGQLASLNQIVTALEGWQAAWTNTPVGSQWNVLGHMADLTTSLKDMGLDFRGEQWTFEARLIATMKTALASAPMEARGNSVEYEGFVAGLEGFANELRWRNLDATGLLFAGMLVANPDLVETSQNTPAAQRGSDRRGLLEIMARTADRMDNHLAWAIKDAERLESLGIPNTVNQVILSALPVLEGALSVARATADLGGERTNKGLFGLGQKAGTKLAAVLEEKGFSQDVVRQLREMRITRTA